VPSGRLDCQTLGTGTRRIQVERSGASHPGRPPVACHTFSTWAFRGSSAARSTWAAFRVPFRTGSPPANTEPDSGACRSMRETEPRETSVLPQPRRRLCTPSGRGRATGIQQWQRYAWSWRAKGGGDDQKSSVTSSSKSPWLPSVFKWPSRMGSSGCKATASRAFTRLRLRPWVPNGFPPASQKLSQKAPCAVRHPRCRSAALVRRGHRGERLRR